MGDIPEKSFLIKDGSEETKKAILKNIADLLKIEVPKPLKADIPSLRAESYIFINNGSKVSLFYNPDNGRPNPYISFYTSDSDLGQRVAKIIRKYR